MGDPQIPAALAPAVAGIVSMHDFMPRKTLKMRIRLHLNGSATIYAVVPADLATIYNLNPLFGAPTGISGQGQTIVVIEDTMSLALGLDHLPLHLWAFGLHSGSLTTVHPAPQRHQQLHRPGRERR